MKPQKQAKPPIKKKADVVKNTTDSKSLKNWLGILISVFAFLLYAQSISFDYTLDDTAVIKENSVTNKGIAAIPTILKTEYLSGTKDAIKGPAYRPASLIMFAIESQFFPRNPHANHFMNVLLYALSCLVLFLLLCKLFKNQNLIFPFICALLFTAHPIHTEVVNNIKSRDEIMCFLFGIMSLFLAVKAVEKKTIVLVALSAICFFISLLSKESGIPFLFLIPLTLFVFTKADFKKIASVTLALAAASGVYFLIRYRVLASIPELNWNISVVNNSLNAAPDIISQKATAFYILLKYLLLLVFPHPLSYDYSFAQIPIQKIGSPAAIIAIVVYLAMGIYAFLNIRKKDVVAFSILFFLIAIVPVSNLFLLIGSPMAERFLYTPSLGFCILLTYLLIKVTKTETVKSRFSTFRQLIFGNFIFLIVFIFVGIFSIKIFARNPHWKDNVSLFGHDVTVSDNSGRAHFNWGNEILNTLFPKEKDRAVQSNLLEKAIAELNKSTSIYPDNGEVYLILSNAYLIKDDFPNALKSNETAQRLFRQPDSKVFYNFSRLYDRAGQFDKSLAAADSAIMYAPNISFTYNQKGVVLSKLQRYEEAINAFQQCINLDPEFVMAYKNTGICYLNLKQGERALEFFNKAQSMDPEDPSYSKLIESARQKMNDQLNAK